MSPTPKQAAEARAVLRSFNRARAKDRAPRLPAKPKATHGRERDPAYLAWLHEGLSCIACLILGPTGTRIEAAHQKLNCADRGWHKKLGIRPTDAGRTLPLCRSHHREGPVCCDPAQAKFWALVGLSVEQVIDLCGDLYGAFPDAAAGEAVIRRYAREARA